MSPMWPRIAGEDWHHVIKTANQETVLVLQIESQRAHENIDAIKQIPGIDVPLVGPLDLSASIGKITETGCSEVGGGCSQAASGRQPNELLPSSETILD